ncbi:MAG TPA: TRAP transporter small permease [Alphaproteobacteria bacterium]|jgi:TRAP-type C4-dicarboxylate transport system permease small subunit
MDRFVEGLERAAIRATRVIALVGLAALLVLSIMIMADVGMRWLFNAPIAGVEDLSRLIVAIAVAASLPAVLASRQNITIRFLGHALGRRAEVLLELFGALFVLAIMAAMAWQIQIYTDELRATRETTWLMAIPVAPFWQVVSALLFLCVPIQFVVIAGLIVVLMRGRRLSDHDLIVSDREPDPSI